MVDQGDVSAAPDSRPKTSVPAAATMTAATGTPATGTPATLPPPMLDSGESRISRATAAGMVSPKVTWAAAAAAISTVLWTIVAAVAPHVFSAADITALTGATATVLAFLGGWIARDTLRHDTSSPGDTPRRAN